ncbi:Sterol O-acyltransferase 1 [Frankliniella fusca]|uniref:Sterol O-acyltransferase 1 n=1 Tax=Frankliniella fusca TaxID=407009 RepID=A0AAE1H7P8_9NEOP|nr:Sterol O-acyltransferase 1 [Frankliniella fusca]
MDLLCGISLPARNKYDSRRPPGNFESSRLSASPARTRHTAALRRDGMGVDGAGACGVQEADLGTGTGPPASPALAKQREETVVRRHEQDLAVHGRTAYSVAILASGTYFVYLILEDIKKDGSVSILHWSLLARSFSPRTLAHLVGLWLSLNAALVCANVGFRCWRAGRGAKFAQNPFFWDGMWVLAALMLHVAMLVVPVVVAYLVDLPASAICALCCEQTRLLMKSYAYLREHVRAALADPRRDSNDSLSHLAYYMFAPTLMYCDTYERAARVRPAALLGHAAAFLATLCTMVVATGRGALRPFCAEDAVLLDLVPWRGAPRHVYQLGLVLLRAVPAGAVLALGSGQALHHWHRVFAEGMRFRERAFTGAWLNKYIFKEMLSLGFSSLKCKIVTVMVSAAFHEYVTAVSLGYLVPYFFIFYISGAVFVLLDPFGLQKQSFGNLFVILTYSGGVASLLSFYFTESTARIHCPKLVEGPLDIFIPRSFMCENPFNNCTFI